MSHLVQALVFHEADPIDMLTPERCEAFLAWYLEDLPPKDVELLRRVAADQGASDEVAIDSSRRAVLDGLVHDFFTLFVPRGAAGGRRIDGDSPNLAAALGAEASVRRASRELGGLWPDLFGPRRFGERRVQGGFQCNSLGFWTRDEISAAAAALAGRAVRNLESPPQGWHARAHRRDEPVVAWAVEILETAAREGGGLLFVLG
jgi:hypothetical protein